MLDFHLIFFYKTGLVQVLKMSSIGNSVKVGDGPAAVIRDENR